MAVETPTRVSLKIKVTTALAILTSLVAGAATAVSTLYRVRDDTVKTVMERQQQILQNYPNREEFMRVINTMNQRQEDRDTSLRAKIDEIGAKVDGVIVYLRRKL